MKIKICKLLGFKIKTLAISCVFLGAFLIAQESNLAQEGNKVSIHSDQRGFKLKVDGKDTLIKGIVWDYEVIGENYSYDLWSESDEFIKEVLDYEMNLIKKVGFNAIRSFRHTPARWVEYIYDKWGIMYMPNHFMGRYGNLINGTWIVPINYANPAQRKAIIKEIVEYMKPYVNTRGVIGYLLGNENNYGLEWLSHDIQALPKGERQKARAVYLYTLYEEAIQAIKKLDPNRPVAIANGDLQYIDLIAKYCPSLDFLGANVYRGITSRDLFQEVKEKLNIPFFYTEFGCDAFNAKTKQEEDWHQAYYLSEQWRQIYLESYGKGRSGTAIGGFVFSWADGWWKYLLEERLDIHDTTASWGATWGGGYAFDHSPGFNNMNEEWWGIATTEYPDSKGITQRELRTAARSLNDVFKYDLYSAGASSASINQYFDKNLAWAKENAENPSYVSRALARSEKRQRRFRVDGVSLYSAAIVAGDGEDREIRENNSSNNNVDTWQYANIEFGFNPFDNLSGGINLHFRSRLPDRRVQLHRFLYYGFSGARSEPNFLLGSQQIEIYRAWLDYTSPWVDVKFLYREGHYHWRYEGDFFNFYQETFHYEEYDQYEQVTPYGFYFTGKKAIEGLKLAIGPEVALGSAPGFILKYRTPNKYMPSWLALTFIHQEDIAGLGFGDPSRPAKPAITGRRSSVVGEFKLGKNVDLALGILWGGNSEIGRDFTKVVRVSEEGDTNTYNNSGYDVYEDKIEWIDTFGYKLNLTFVAAMFQGYLQAAYHGLVADGRGSPHSLRPAANGWYLRDDGQGNKVQVLGGFVAHLSRAWSIAPNGMYRRPLVGANPNVARIAAVATPRNYVSDPFAVVKNRETYAGEIQILYDPTPETWFYAWNNDLKENAKFLWQLRFVYQNHPTETDGDTFYQPSQQSWLPFTAGLPAAETYYADTKMVFNLARNSLKMILHLYVGYEQALGNDASELYGERQVFRKGGTFSLFYKGLDIKTYLKFDDWGYYEFQRQFNITFPFQALFDIGWNFSPPRPFKEKWKVGTYLEWKTIDQFSQDRFGQDFDITKYPSGQAHEWAVGVYVHLNLLYRG